MSVKSSKVHLAEFRRGEFSYRDLLVLQSVRLSVLTPRLSGLVPADRSTVTSCLPAFGGEIEARAEGGECGSVHWV